MAIKVQFYNIAPEGAILQEPFPGSLAEWFKAPDLGSGIFGCVSSNLTALIFLSPLT